MKRKIEVISFIIFIALSLAITLRATAALFKLFWNEVNIDWSFFHHTLYRTGVTALKGDYRPSNIENVNIILNNADDFVSRIVIADTDGNGLQEAIVTTAKQNVGGKVYSVEKSAHDQTAIKWSYNRGRTVGSPAVFNVDTDIMKEVFYATDHNYGGKKYENEFSI